MDRRDSRSTEPVNLQVMLDGLQLLMDNLADQVEDGGQQVDKSLADAVVQFQQAALRLAHVIVHTWREAE